MCSKPIVCSAYAAATATPVREPFSSTFRLKRLNDLKNRSARVAAPSRNLNAKTKNVGTSDMASFSTTNALPHIAAVRSNISFAAMLRLFSLESAIKTFYHIPRGAQNFWGRFMMISLKNPGARRRGKG